MSLIKIDYTVLKRLLLYTESLEDGKMNLEGIKMLKEKLGNKTVDQQINNLVYQSSKLNDKYTGEFSKEDCNWTKIITECQKFEAVNGGYKPEIHMSEKLYNQLMEPLKIHASSTSDKDSGLGYFGMFQGINLYSDNEIDGFKLVMDRKYGE